MLYEPAINDTPGTAAKTDVETSFSIVVESSDTSLTAEQVKGFITAVDTNSLDNEENVISVTGSNGTYTITGLKPHYSDDGRSNTSPASLPDMPIR